MYLLGHALAFWCYAENTIPAACLPMIVLQLHSGLSTAGLRLSAVLFDLPARHWTYVEVPFRAFTPITADIDFLRNSLCASQPVSPPTHLTARGFDRHVDRRWEHNADPEIEYYLIYRSDDGENFSPIGVQNPVVVTH